MTPEGIKRVAVFCIIKSGDQYLLLKLDILFKLTPYSGHIDPPDDLVVYAA